MLTRPVSMQDVEPVRWGEHNWQGNRFARLLFETELRFWATNRQAQGVQGSDQAATAAFFQRRRGFQNEPRKCTFSAQHHHCLQYFKALKNSRTTYDAST